MAFRIGDDYYPLPWEKLHYDEELDGYRIDLTKEQIENAPHFANWTTTTCCIRETARFTTTTASHLTGCRSNEI